MEFNDLIFDKCNDAHNLGPQKISLAGKQDNALSIARALVSRFNKRKSSDITTRYDKATKILTIASKQDLQRPPKTKIVDVPSCLFVFLNRKPVSREEMQDLLKFHADLGQQLADAEPIGPDPDEILI